MSRELSRLYQALAEDADRRDLVLPEAVRRRADRRARVRVAGALLAAAMLLGGTAVGTQLALTSGRTPLEPPAGTPTPVVTSPLPTPSATCPSTPPPSTAGAPTPGRSGTPGASAGSVAPPPPVTPTSIPDRAFFTLPPANDTGITPFFNEGEVLPSLCDVRYPSDSSIVQRRARNLAFHLREVPEGYVPDGSYRHSITIYRPGRAESWMRELRQAVRDCPEQQTEAGTTSRQRLLSGGAYGDESVFFELRAPHDVNGDPAGTDEIRLVRAIRIGDVVTVLWEQGWESTSSPRSQVDTDSRRATAAIEKWLG